MLTVAEILTITDGIAGSVEAAAAPLASLKTRATAQVGRIYGVVAGGVVTTPPLSDSAAIDALGPATKQSVTQVSGPGFYAAALGPVVAALSSYFARQAQGGQVVDLTSFLRTANGCPDASRTANGAGSNYTRLAHPSYAGLVATLSGGASLLPPDVVFAPTGTLLATLVVGSAGIGGGTLGQPTAQGGLPYAPTLSFSSMAGIAGVSGIVPDGSLFATLTGLNQAGVSVTWRGDVGTGYSGAGSYLSPRTLRGTDGGANGGTAAPTDRLVQVTALVRDMTVSGGGTATVGAVSVICVGERPAL